MEQENEKVLNDKALIAFGGEFLCELDMHWKSLKSFSNRSEYIKHLVRRDMEQNGQVQR